MTTALNPSSSTSTPLVNRLWRSVHRMVTLLMAYPRRPGFFEPHPTHVSENARRFRSPLTHHSEVLRLLSTDKDFIYTVGKSGLDCVLEASCDGRTVYANLYHLESRHQMQLNPALESEVDPQDATDYALYETRDIFDKRWPETGVYRYVIHLNGDVAFVSRPITQYGFDPSTPVLSYQRMLNQDEVAEFSVMCHA